MLEAIEGMVEPVAFDDGAGSYLPASPSLDLRRAVERISQAMAPRINILYGAALATAGIVTRVYGLALRSTPSSLIPPRTRTREQPSI